MGKLNGTLDKIGVGGVIVAALSCAACFPALGALAATLGLGFLSQLEGVAINTLLPAFVCLALILMLAISVADLVRSPKPVCPLPGAAQ